MPALSPTAQRREKATQARHRRPEERPDYKRLDIAARVEIRFPAPPPTGSAFVLVAGRGQVETTRYKMWRADAAFRIASAKPTPKRIAGLCDVEIHLPPFSGKAEYRVRPCLDAACAAGIIAGTGEDFVREVGLVPTRGTDAIRMVLTSIPVSDADAAIIELKAKDGHPPNDIAAQVGVSVGQVETVLAGVGHG